MFQYTYLITVWVLQASREAALGRAAGVPASAATCAGAAVGRPATAHQGTGAAAPAELRARAAATVRLLQR